jgi:hypothetical protein
MINANNCAVVLGVPAFKPGWEMNTFANNIHVIKQFHISGGVHFCGAENPAAAFEVLEGIYSELDAGERMYIAPIGTKPHGIGAALYAVQNPQVGVLYDHPARRANRSTDLARWHLFDVEF